MNKYSKGDTVQIKLTGAVEHICERAGKTPAYVIRLPKDGLLIALEHEITSNASAIAAIDKNRS